MKGDEYFFNKFCQKEYYEESKETHHFPEIIDNERQEEIANQIIESVPHKLPGLGNKYRKILKESSSDEFEPKIKSQTDMPELRMEGGHKYKGGAEAELASKYT